MAVLARGQLWRQLAARSNYIGMERCGTLKIPQFRTTSTDTKAVVPKGIADRLPKSIADGLPTSSDIQEEVEAYIASWQPAIDNLRENKIPQLQAALSRIELDPRARFQNWQKQTRTLVDQQEHWGVEWCGHADKRTCVVDGEDVFQAFKRWGDFQVIHPKALDWAQKKIESGADDWFAVQQPPDEVLTPEGLRHKRTFDSLRK